MDLNSILLDKKRKMFGLSFLNGSVDNTNNTNNTTDTIISSNITSLGNIRIGMNCILNNSVTILSTISTTSNLVSTNITANNIFINDSLITFSIISCSSSIYSNSCICNNIYSTKLDNTNCVINSTTILSILNGVTATATINNMTVNNNLYVSSYGILNSCTINNILCISNSSVMQNVTVNTNLVVSGISIINNDLFSNNNNISGNIITNNITTQSISIKDDCTLNNIVIKNNCTCNNSMNITSTATFNKLNIYNLNILNNIPEFNDNNSANVLPLWSFYRTGGIVKIRIPDISPVITLNGDNPINIFINDILNDPGVTSTDTIVTSGTVSTSKAGSYIKYYTAYDSNNNILNTITRTFIVNLYPIISSIIKSNSNIVITIIGIYDYLTYKILKNNISIVDETQSMNTTINISSLTPDTNYIIYIYLKRLSGDILTSDSYTFNV